MVLFERALPGKLPLRSLFPAFEASDPVEEKIMITLEPLLNA
jgi:hypothetical protein